jgi:outer membrane protein
MRKRFIAIATTLVALVLAVPATAHEQGTWILRGGAGMVSPKSDNLDFGTTNLEDGTVIENSYIQVDDGSSLILSGTYMLYDNWAVDILGAWPFEHDIDLTGTVNGSSVSVPIGSTKHLPPTVSLQYHFAPDATFQPYVGFGVNYTMFSSESVDQAVQDAAGLLAIKLEDSSGYAAQVGADWVFGDKWLLNVDVRYIQIKSELLITVDDGGNIIENIPVPGRVEINPWVFGVSVGYRF